MHGMVYFIMGGCEFGVSRGHVFSERLGLPVSITGRKVCTVVVSLRRLEFQAVMENHGTVKKFCHFIIGNGESICLAVSHGRVTQSCTIRT